MKNPIAVANTVIVTIAYMAAPAGSSPSSQHAMAAKITHYHEHKYIRTLQIKHMVVQVEIHNFRKVNNRKC